MKGSKNKYDLGKDFPDVYLTRREAECTLLLVNHYTHMQIAEHLNISVYSVQFILKQLYAKVNIQTEDELINIILDTQLLARLDFTIEDLCEKGEINH